MNKLLSILLFLVIALLPFASFLRGPLKSNSSLAFILILLYYSVLVVALGFIVSRGNILAIIIDRRNMVSLSKLQMALWTILVVSGFVAIAALKNAFGIPNPLDIAIPETVWVLMGISTASFIGSPLLKNQNFNLPESMTKEIENRVQDEVKKFKDNNSGKDPTDDEKKTIRADIEKKVMEEFKTDSGVTDEKKLIGTEIANKDPKDASIFDIFRGEEIGNFRLPDLGKIQMFLFTIIVWAAYAMLVYQIITRMTVDEKIINALVINATSTNATLADLSMNKLSGMTNFPDISGGMAALLGISNASYLAYKGIPRENAE